MKSKISKKLIPILTSILVTLAIYSGALLIYLYASGWRLDFATQSIKQTGVLTIESKPTLANIYINDEAKGRTDKSTSLDVGTYTIKVTKDGYYDWVKEIDILEELSTPVFPWLIRDEFEEASIYSTENKLVKYWIDESNNHLILLLETEDTYELLHYDINTEFWELNNNPVVILTLENKDDYSDININFSNTGELALLEITYNEAPSTYLIQTNRVTTYDTLDSINLSAFKDYQTSWSEDDKYLVLESEDEVISYDLSRNTKHLLLKHNDDLDIWTTDNRGFFYILNHTDTSEEDIVNYTLMQYRLDGSSPKELISDVYFHNNNEYIENFRSNTFTFDFFTNSPECTQTIGTVTEFLVNQQAKGIYIKTTQSTYWYDMLTGKYITVSPYPVDFLEFAPDNDQLLFINSDYEIFTFDKEDADHTVEIGSRKIENIITDQVNKIDWVSNSGYLALEEDNFIYIIDRDGDNKTPLLSNENVLYWSITTNRESLVILKQSETTGLEIIKYTIN